MNVPKNISLTINIGGDADPEFLERLLELIACKEVEVTVGPTDDEPEVYDFWSRDFLRLDDLLKFIQENTHSTPASAAGSANRMFRILLSGYGTGPVPRAVVVCKQCGRARSHCRCRDLGVFEKRWAIRIEDINRLGAPEDFTPLQKERLEMFLAHWKQLPDKE